MSWFIIKSEKTSRATAMLDDQDDPPRLLRMLFQPAVQELRANI
jgi:hypothetical protein